MWVRSADTDVNPVDIHVGGRRRLCQCVEMDVNSDGIHVNSGAVTWMSRPWTPMSSTPLNIHVKGYVIHVSYVK